MELKSRRKGAYWIRITRRNVGTRLQRVESRKQVEVSKYRKIEAKNNPKKDKSIPRGATRNSSKETVMRTEKMDPSLNHEPRASKKQESKYPSRNRKKPRNLLSLKTIAHLIP